MRYLRHPIARLCGASLLLLAACAAGATTTQEEQLFKSPSPHQALSGGAMVRVHRARLDGYSDLGGGNAAAVAALKQEVQACVASHRGGQVKPPSAWPDYRSATRTDEYVAANRRIVYTSGVGYVVHPGDCSLISEVVASATLSSDQGSCQIDLNHKTARGNCDRGGHADAPQPRPPGPGKDEVLRQMERNPALAAMAAQMKQMRQYDLVRTGEQRTIQGARCEVWRQPVPGSSNVGTFCYATGGAFVPYGVRDGRLGGLLIDSATTGGLQLKAVEVKLDTQVSSAVFTPYLAAGFTLEKEQP
ncbi:hypothetical protein GJ697_26715 [Pseudoduganella sp. FT25W]|uniref:Uncharacterized protein n=1 Tax=Duganella alba TaxID=2666081 RepID=A0A6L5QQ40_9BURK|nr:hypothetical protein [Duganella alba]MRX11422.1 hypothetical protein [Duganella alba]MRX19589.1 hypothetical protein [Duganella alba]